MSQRRNMQPAFWPNRAILNKPITGFIHLKSIIHRLSALLQQLAYRIQEWEETVNIGQQVISKSPPVEIALMNAFSYAIMGKATPAVGWLRCAMQQGLHNVQEIIKKREFDAIRNSADFQSLLKSLENG